MKRLLLLLAMTCLFVLTSCRTYPLTMVSVKGNGIDTSMVYKTSYTRIHNDLCKQFDYNKTLMRIDTIDLKWLSNKKEDVKVKRWFTTPNFVFIHVRRTDYSKKTYWKYYKPRKILMVSDRKEYIKNKKCNQ